MKLKQTPADFRVEELTEARPDGPGPFAFYRLCKTGWTTPDALQQIARSWNLRYDQFGYGGLKDRHAETIQYLTIFRGPKRNYTAERIDLEFLGNRFEPFSSREISANRFAVVLRDLKRDEIDPIAARAEAVGRVGMPNYFDDQRFGSVTPDGQFVAKELCLGRFENALKLALAAPYEHDRADAKKEKAILLEHWADWPTCKAKLPKGHARSLVTYLADHPTNFKGAIARLRPELQGLYLSAYQSDLWNRILAKWLIGKFPAESLSSIQQHRGSLPVVEIVPSELEPRWNEFWLPLPSPRLKPEPEADYWAQLEAVLLEEGLSLKQLKVQGLDKPFFSKGERVACLRPRDLRWQTAPDELNRNREKLTLNFDLPRGAYATLIVKRISGSND